MAKAASKSAVNTTLAIEQVEIPVSLFTAVQGPAKTQTFDSAGPNGGKLKHEVHGVAAPEPEPGPDAEPAAQGDPLGGENARSFGDVGAHGGPDPGPERTAEETLAEIQAGTDAAAALVDGEFRQVLVEDGTGDVVEPDQVRKGVRLDSGAFIDVTDQLAAIEERTKLDRMSVVSFIDVGQVPRHRVLSSYYLGTDDADARVALKTLALAMREKRRAAVVKWSSKSRQSLGVIVPFARTRGEESLLVLKLAWAEDFREAPLRAQLAGVAVPEYMVSVAMSLVEAKSDTRESMDELRDDALALREELKARAEAGEMDVQVVEPVEAPVAAAAFGDQLAASLAQVRS